MHVAGEAEKRSAVIGEDGAVDAHQAADRYPGIPREHLVAHQVEWRLRAGHIRTNEIAETKRQLAGYRPNVGPESIGQARKQAAKQPNKFGRMGPLEKLDSLVYLGEQPLGLANVEGDSHRDEGNLVAHLVGGTVAAHVYRNDDAECAS